MAKLVVDLLKGESLLLNKDYLESGDADALYLQIADDLSDVINIATARTNLGLVAGGAGDIWVEKAGDDMTGELFGTDIDLSGAYKKNGTVILDTITASDNVMVGEGAGDAITTGSGLVAVGKNALGAETDGTDSVAIGSGALGKSDGGAANFAIGKDACRDLTTGSECFAIGISALQRTTTATRNLGIGPSALRLATTGHTNIVVGRIAGAAITTGFQNMMFGNGAGGAFDVGDNNVCVGNSTMLSVVTANRNVAIGSDSLRRSATATDNVCIGSSAGNGTATFTAIQNVFIGKQSGLNIETSTRNTCLGYQSGEFMTSSEGNILIGASVSGHTLTTGGNNLLLGYDINLPSDTADNQMTIGNLLFSEGIDGVGLGISTGNLGIGVVAPSEKLHINGNLRIGIGAAGVDYKIMVDGETNDGVVTWMEDEDHWRFNDDIALDNGEFLVFDKAAGQGIKVDTSTGNATFGWADLLGDQFSRNTGATKATLTPYNGAIDAWQFADGDEAYLTYHIPHDYVIGTDIHLHIHWSQTSSTATGGTIGFKYFAIYAKGHNQVVGSAFTSTPITASFSSIDINDGGSGLNQYQHHLTEVIISGASATSALFDRDDLEPDGVIELTFEMDTNSLTNSVTVLDPFIHYVDIHYQTTSLIGTKDKVPDFYA